MWSTLSGLASTYPLCCAICITPTSLPMRDANGNKDGETHSAQVEMMLPGWMSRHREQDDFSPPIPPARLPRITRLMALAIKFQDMVSRGDARDYADLAR